MRIPFEKSSIDLKTATHILVVLGLFLLVTGCKPSHRINFKPASVSIDPREGWKRLNIPAMPPVCSPRLISKAGVINVLLLDDFTDIKKATDMLQERFTTTTKAMPDSFKREDFLTDSGVKGIHLSYTTWSAHSTTPDARSHSFITQNRLGKCVSISYITSPDRESAAVLEAIRKTLRVE